MSTTTPQSVKVGRAVPLVRHSLGDGACPPQDGSVTSLPLPRPESAQSPARPAFARGFTLIELLVVITIMGIIASMVVGLSGMAARKKRDAVVTGMKSKLVLLISSYQSKMGFFPPDNATNAIAIPGSPLYEQTTGMNSLIYELTGAPVVNGTNFLAFDGTILSGSILSLAYGRGGIANSLPDETHVFYQPLPGPKDYTTNIVLTIPLKQLKVPVDLIGVPTNLWHYDCSNPNRHNPTTFDLWAEYSAGSDKAGNPIIITNGNWKLP